jgi:transcriptional regulator with XRE-family HTH domain
MDNRVKELRKQKKWRLVDLTAATNLNMSWLWAIENGNMCAKYNLKKLLICTILPRAPPIEYMESFS